jgi:DUF1680 family protein
MSKSAIPTAAPTRREVLQALASISALSLASSRAAGNGALPGSSGRVIPFELTSVRLLPGPFATARDLDARYLLSLEPDRLLHNFRVNAGLEPKAPVYGGWESQEPWVEIRCHGHTLGHYLSACAMMAAATSDQRFQERVAYIVAELAACQQARGDGLICAFPDGATQLENALAGRPITGVPWYTLHKVMAGLRDAYTIAQNQQALQVLTALADWIDAASRSVDEARFQKMLDVEHGGMNEVLADLYVLTGGRRYLALAERFSHHALLDPLSAQRDVLNGLHSNTQIPKVVGFARIHDLTADPRYNTAAEFFWRVVSQQRSFATGGHGDSEHFFPTDEFAQHLGSAKTMETCCTHNMLRLTRALFLKQPVSAYADYYERALFNGILASQDPVGGGFTYFQATRPGYPKLYCTPTDSFWCCTGTGMENHAKYGDSVYFQSPQALYVNLFIASELNWREQGLTIAQLTRFPDEPRTQLRVRAAKPTRLRLKIRQPAWCARASCKLNGRPQAALRGPDGYLEINRIWRDGDVLDVELPMHSHVAALPGSTEIAALMYGPLVLAARCGTDGITPGADIIVNERTSGDMLNVPMSLPQLDGTAANLDEHLVRKADGPLSFSLRAQQQQLDLIPYYRVAHERYNLYWRYRPSGGKPTPT